MSSSRVLAIMPVYNEARYLRRVLQSLRAQTYDVSRLSIIAVDGASSDGSCDILQRWAEECPASRRVLLNPRRKIPISLNMALRHAGDYDVVVRLDAHTVYDATYIGDAVAALESAAEDVGCVGCAHVPLPGTVFRERLVQALYTNPMGLGGADFRFGCDVREVDNIYLGSWPTKVLAQTGGFDESLEANEDGEMSARIRKLGYRILRVPLPCRFIINRSPLATIRQWHRYGYWRAKMLQRNPGFTRPRHAISLSATVLVPILAATSLRFLLVPLCGCYAGMVLRHRAKEESAAVTLASLLFFPALQAAYSAGMWRGLLSGRR